MPSPDSPGTRLATRLAFFTAGFIYSCWAALVPFAKARVAVDDAALGLLLLFLGIGSIIAMPVTGALAARWGSKPMILGGGCALVVFLPLLAYADSPAGLAAALFGFGASLGTMDVAMNIHAVEVERASERALMSGFHALFSIGGFAGAGGMTLLLANGMPPLVATVAAGFLGIFALAVAGPRLLKAKGEPIRFVLPRGIVLLFSALAAATFLVEGAILDWSALLVSDAKLVDVAHGGLGYMIFAIAMTAGRLTGDRCVEILGNTRVLFWSGIVAVAGFILLLTVPVAWIAMSGFFLIGLGASNVVPVIFSLAGRQTEMPASLAIASLTTIGYAGILAGPAGIGFLSHAIGLQGAFWLLAGLMLLVSLTAGRVTKAE